MQDTIFRSKIALDADLNHGAQMKETRDWVGLSLAAGLGPAGFWALIGQLGSPTAVLDASYKELQSLPGLTSSQRAGLSDREKLRALAEQELERLHKADSQAITFKNQHYPVLLKNCVNPPPILYIKGNKRYLNSHSVAIVGSRAATSYGRRTAFMLARDFAAGHVSVVSGLAAGIDTQAHLGCLEAGGITLAVLGCGLDVVYPRINRKLYEQIASKGVLVTEYPLGTKPEGFRFPARNRIIAGISYGVVVVEAAKKSGSLITVQCALDEGRDVFAVPGQIDSVKSGGTHWLLQQGASLIVSAKDVIEQLPIECSCLPGKQKSLSTDLMDLDEDSLKLLSLLESYPIGRDELAQTANMSPSRLSEYLLLLELEGLVELLPGNEIRRVVHEHK